MVRMNCSFPKDLRTPTFWTTQPDACGSGEDCAGNVCGSLGLAFAKKADCALGCSCCGEGPAVNNDCSPPPFYEEPKTFVNTNWLRGLALNMLNTNARRADSVCGVRPGALAGHWSESYNANGPRFGTHLRELTPKGSIRELVQAITLELQTTLGKLVTYGVATKVDVAVVYRGNATVSADATLYTTSGLTEMVGLTAKKTGNTWAWQ